MPYQSRPGEWPLTTAWNWLVNTVMPVFPALFDCRRMTLAKVQTRKQFDNLCEILEKMGAVKVAEDHPPSGEGGRYYFRLEKKPIAIIVKEHRPIRIIAPEPLIEHIRNKLKVFLD